MTQMLSKSTSTDESGLTGSDFRIDHLSKVFMFTRAADMLIEGRELSKDDDECLDRVLSFVKKTIDAAETLNETASDMKLCSPEAAENYRFFLSAVEGLDALGDKNATTTKEEFLKKVMGYLKDLRDELDSIKNFGNAGSCRQKVMLIGYLVAMRTTYINAKMLREFDRIGSPIF